MAAFIPVPNAVRSSMIYLMDSQTIVNTLTFRLATEPTPAQMDALNLALHTWYTASFKPNLTAQIALIAITTIGLWSQSAPGRTRFVAAEPGTLAATGDPANVAYCVSLRTGLRGRNFRGRIYIPTVGSNVKVGQNSITSAFAAAVSAALAQLLTPANVANFIWCVASRYLNKLPRAQGITTDITTTASDLTLDSQRRRLPGRGA